MKDTFSFEGAVVANKPFIPFASFSDLDVGTVLKGQIDSVVTYKEMINLEVVINGHVTKVALFNHTLEAAKALIGTDIKIRLTGFNESNGVKYPKFSIKW